jgi:hypothetical protein
LTVPKVWDDTQLKAGDELDEINKHLIEADILILFLKLPIET